MTLTPAAAFLCSGSQNPLTPAADSLRALVFSSRFAMKFSFRFQRGEDGKKRSSKLHDGNSEALQFGLIADTRLHENLVVPSDRIISRPARVRWVLPS
jgi:hypothetical protein